VRSRPRVRRYAQGREPPRPGGKDWDAIQRHVGEAGDTLSKIARKQNGDASLCKRIFEATRDQPRNPGLVKVGQWLRIT